MTDYLLDKLAATITAGHDLESLARPLLVILQEITGLESTFLTSIDLARGELRVVFTHNSGAMRIPEGLVNPWNETLCKRASDEGILHTDEVDRRWPDVAIGRELRVMTYLSEPLCAEDGTLYGTLCGASGTRRPLSDRNRRLLGMFSRLITLQIERERHIAQLEIENRQLSSAALEDPLTKIPNRRAMEQELARCLAHAARNDLQLHLAFMDLDGFKAINDTYGHDAGDHLLVALSAKLSKHLREGDFIARYGGDEFVFFCSTAPGAAARHQRAIAKRLLTLTQGRFKVGEKEFHYLGASIGMVSAQPGESALELLQRADAAMYQDKAARKPRLVESELAVKSEGSGI